MNIKTKLKEQKAITLIALVVTIIVLLILAGVSIAMLAGDNGILQRATDAKIRTDEEQIKERIKLAYNSALADGKGSYTKESLEDELEKEFGADFEEVDDSNDTNWILKAKGKSVTIPAGKAVPQSNGKIASDIFESNGTTEEKMHVGDYVNYPVYYDNVASFAYDDGSKISRKNYPADIYTGWRVLSIDGTGNNQYIRLVSAGVPLNYYMADAEILTTKFFNMPNDNGSGGIIDYGFKSSQTGTTVTSISEVKELFNNTYTAKYADGEIATYTDNESNQEYTNSNVVGQPKVQSLTKNDVDKVWGVHISKELYGNGTDVTSNNLLAIPCKGNESSMYSFIWLASDASGDSGGIYSNGKVSYWDPWNDTRGIRCVVSLMPNVKFTLSEESNSTDSVKTWNLE